MSASKRCEDCDVDFTSKDEAVLHSATIKHQMGVKKADVSAVLKCLVCNYTCTTLPDFSKHVLTVVHANKQGIIEARMNGETVGRQTKNNKKSKKGKWNSRDERSKNPSGGGEQQTKQTPRKSLLGIGPVSLSHQHNESLNDSRYMQPDSLFARNSWNRASCPTGGYARGFAAGYPPAPPVPIHSADAFFGRVTNPIPSSVVSQPGSHAGGILPFRVVTTAEVAVRTHVNGRVEQADNDPDRRITRSSSRNNSASRETEDDDQCDSSFASIQSAPEGPCIVLNKPPTKQAFTRGVTERRTVPARPAMGKPSEAVVNQKQKPDHEPTGSKRPAKESNSASEAPAADPREGTSSSIDDKPVPPVKKPKAAPKAGALAGDRMRLFDRLAIAKNRCSLRDRRYKERKEKYVVAGENDEILDGGETDDVEIMPILQPQGSATVPPVTPLSRPGVAATGKPSPEYARVVSPPSEMLHDLPDLSDSNYSSIDILRDVSDAIDGAHPLNANLIAQSSQRSRGSSSVPAVCASSQSQPSPPSSAHSPFAQQPCQGGVAVPPPAAALPCPSFTPHPNRTTESRVSNDNSIPSAPDFNATANGDGTAPIIVKQESVTDERDPERERSKKLNDLTLREFELEDQLRAVQQPLFEASVRYEVLMADMARLRQQIIELQEKQKACNTELATIKKEKRQLLAAPVN